MTITGTARNHRVFFVDECDWDPEHGLEVRFRNGVADDADQIGEIGW
ncbi:hypothetical protein [Nostoc sp. KVJ20]|nr:hypothetical protein [Nostoc sp. KVJ20]